MDFKTPAFTEPPATGRDNLFAPMQRRRLSDITVDDWQVEKTDPFRQQNGRTRIRQGLDCLGTRELKYAGSRRGINNSLLLYIAKYVVANVDGLMLSKKKPLYEPSLHCKSVLLATSTREIASASAGEIPAPNEEPEVTAVPANSTPSAPFPVTGS